MKLDLDREFRRLANIFKTPPPFHASLKQSSISHLFNIYRREDPPIHIRRRHSRTFPVVDIHSAVLGWKAEKSDRKENTLPINEDVG